MSATSSHQAERNFRRCGKQLGGRSACAASGAHSRIISVVIPFSLFKRNKRNRRRENGRSPCATGINACSASRAQSGPPAAQAERARELGRQGIPCTRGTGSCLGWHVCLTEPKALRRRAACPIRLQRWRQCGGVSQFMDVNDVRGERETARPSQALKATVAR